MNSSCKTDADLGLITRALSIDHINLYSEKRTTQLALSVFSYIIIVIAICIFKNIYTYGTFTCVIFKYPFLSLFRLKDKYEHVEYIGLLNRRIDKP